MINTNGHGVKRAILISSFVELAGMIDYFYIFL